jgi:hypothetical protein
MYDFLFNNYGIFFIYKILNIYIYFKTPGGRLDAEMEIVKLSYNSYQPYFCNFTFILSFRDDNIIAYLMFDFLFNDLLAKVVAHLFVDY